MIHQFGKPRLLVVEDDELTVAMLTKYLHEQGYEVTVARDAAATREACSHRVPDLILMDVNLPDEDGYQLLASIRFRPVLRQVPVIFVTGQDREEDRIHGLEMGAEDYIVKPFNVAEVGLRISRVLRRVQYSNQLNPLTGLPGNRLIEQMMTECLSDRHRRWAVLYVDLDNFKAFNDKYGFERGDEALKMTARILLIAMREVGTPVDFLGHIGGDDFVLITTPAVVEKLCQKIVTELSRTAASLYDEEDLRQGYILSKDRDGNPRQFPLLTISIGVVTNEQKPIKHVAEVAQLGAERKHWAKTHGGNRWVKDRRGD